MSPFLAQRMRCSTGEWTVVVFCKRLTLQPSNDTSYVCRYPVQSQLSRPVWGSGYSDESYSGGSEDARTDPAGATTATATWC